ncbi:MAG: cyanophycin synthetase, partial [Chitinophagaceae bacterium]|nr:cyanophycin synthetase [Chitinophagaceae bacterium]
MQIESIKVLNGPNYWSISRHQLIVILLNLNGPDTENTFLGITVNEITLSSDRTNSCIVAIEKGLVRRIRKKTPLPRVIEYLIVEIQALAGIKTTFSKTETAKGLCQIIFSYEGREAGIYAAKTAVNIIDSIVNKTEFELCSKIEKLKEVLANESMGPSTASIVAEALKRNIPCTRLDEGSLVQLGYGKKQKRIEATIASTTSTLSTDLAEDKQKTKEALKAAYVPVPEGTIIQEEEQLQTILQQVPFPLVIKPCDGNQGKGVTTNIRNSEEVTEAFRRARNFSPKVIFERFIEGKDYRILVINYKFIAAAMRTPATVIGDGVHTIQELIEKVNLDPRRAKGHSNTLTKIIVDDVTHNRLSKKAYSLETILPADEELWLKPTANLSTGGTSTDVTDTVHPANISMFERIARTIGLDICGIDVIAPTLETSVAENGGAVIEVNAAPGFRMHLNPTIGSPRNVAEPVLDMLFPSGETSRIPVVAITGTNGKTTTTRLIANMAQQAGYTTGYTTTDGIYINKERITKGDCAGPSSARFILQVPSVEFAVLETARGGLLRSGLAFDKCSCAVITNVAEDHLGLNGIDSLDELAKVKAVIAKCVMENGHAVLNADDDRVYAMKDEVNCKVALFSLNSDNARIRQHCRRGGLAAIYDDGHLIIKEGNRLIPVEEVKNIPITFNGTAKFNIANALGASLAAFTSGIDIT